MERARELQAKQEAELQVLEDARNAVDKWNDCVSELASLHKTVATDMADWEKIKSAPPPVKPEYFSRRERFAKAEYRRYKPSFWDKLLFRDTKKRRILLDRISQGRLQDQKDYQLALDNYDRACRKFERLREIASGVSRLDTGAFKSALEFFGTFSSVEKYGNGISYGFCGGMLDIDINALNDGAIPNYELRLTKTEKLSRKEMPKGNFYRLYQGHVCSLILRIAREVFACIPIEAVRINALSDIVDPATGHLGQCPIVSVIIPKKTADGINFEAIDPPECMKNFACNMAFKKTSGLNPVERVEFPG